METALFHLVLHITKAFGTNIAQHLRKDELQGIVAHCTTIGVIGWGYGMVTVI